MVFCLIFLPFKIVGAVARKVKSIDFDKAIGINK